MTATVITLGPWMPSGTRSLCTAQPPTARAGAHVNLPHDSIVQLGQDNNLNREITLSDWATIALSGISVCTGGALTMLGQYFSDRRSYIRDRTARREEFQITNYEIQRSSLLELQETIVKLNHFIGLSSGKNRWSRLARTISPELAVPMQWPEARDLILEYMEQAAKNYELVAEAKDPGELSPERREEIAARARELSSGAMKISRQLKPTLEHLEQLRDLTDHINILAARSGNYDVLTSCKKIIDLTDQWSIAKNADEDDLTAKNAQKQIRPTLDVITEALRKGPFA